jgi:hypothetical protein
MTPHRILQVNALCTAASALGLLATRGTLPGLFGLNGPLLLDVVAAGFFAYAGALALAAKRQPVSRQALITFAVADAAWVVGSAVALAVFWPELAPVGRVLTIAVAVVVEAFAPLQFRAAGTVKREFPQPA